MKKRVILSLMLIGSIAFANSSLYQKECGACHFAYQPELLPKRSWVKMMSNLENHFNTDASLEKADVKAIEEYLTKNSGETSRYKHYRKIINSIRADEIPLRISETAYFIKEHREIPKRLIEQKEVKSISNCNLCHKKADKGNYGERGINIPNYGKWDD